MKQLHCTFLSLLPINRSSGTIFTVNIIAFKADRVFFYMLTKNFQKLKAEVAAHVNADRVAQGSYKTCFIGCLADGYNNPKFIEAEYGIPLMVTRIAESIFEGLSADEAPLFFDAFPKAIGSDGKDLTRVSWKFLAAELRALPPAPDDIQAYIGSVIEGMDLLGDGKEWPEAAFNATSADTLAAAFSDAYAARTARFAWKARAGRSIGSSDAATYAAWSATYAARAAGYTGSATYAAARLRQRDTLLRLIKEAPVN